MTRMVDSPDLTILSGGSASPDSGITLRDAYEIVVIPPATLPEADVTWQFWSGTAWVFFDATNFVAGIDNFKVFPPRGTKYRLFKRAGTVAADRTFGIVKRVAGNG